MPTFRKGHSARDTLGRQITTGQTQTTPAKITWIRDPADFRTLRGIPAIGFGVSGAIAGTRPDQRGTLHDEPNA